MSRVQIVLVLGVQQGKGAHEMNYEDEESTVHGEMNFSSFVW